MDFIRLHHSIKYDFIRAETAVKVADLLVPENRLVECVAVGDVTDAAFSRHVVMFGPGR